MMNHRTTRALCPLVALMSIVGGCGDVDSEAHSVEKAGATASRCVKIQASTAADYIKLHRSSDASDGRLEHSAGWGAATVFQIRYQDQSRTRAKIQVSNQPERYWRSASESNAMVKADGSAADASVYLINKQPDGLYTIRDVDDPSRNGLCVKHGNAALQLQPQSAKCSWPVLKFRLRDVANCSGAPVGPGTKGSFSTRGTKLYGPSGKPVRLVGYRVGIGEVIGGQVGGTLGVYRQHGVAGNAQAFEIWWSRFSPGKSCGPCEPYPNRPGVYRKENMRAYIDAMKQAVARGSYIIPSIRVSFSDYCRFGKCVKKGDDPADDGASWHGWVRHTDLLDNVKVPGTTVGLRKRFFDWIAWVVRELTAVPEIRDNIAYWELWHFPGHRNGGMKANAYVAKYVTQFLPRLIEHYRRLLPDALLGPSFRAQWHAAYLANHDFTYDPKRYGKLIYVIGGYCQHNTIMRDHAYATRYVFPDDCTIAPLYDSKQRRFPIVEYAKRNQVALHSQEGPGLYYQYRTGGAWKLTQNRREMVMGLLELYNARTNGWGFHGLTPRKDLDKDGSWLNKTMRAAIAGTLDLARFTP